MLKRYALVWGLVGTVGVLGRSSHSLSDASPHRAERQRDDSSAVAGVVGAYHAAEAAGDSTAMLALLDDDVVILESGGIESKAEFRAHHIAADIAYIRAVQVERSPI